MSRYSISSNEMIVLRDGRPFGEIGTFSGGFMEWPLPQTLAGMCRTAVGFGRTDNFFRDSTKDDIKNLKNIALKRILPGLIDDNGYSPLLPVPADLHFFLNDNPRVYPMKFKPLVAHENSDIAVAGWRFPFSADGKEHEKPDSAPMFLSSDLADHYVNGTIPVFGKSLVDKDTACYKVQTELRIHSSIDPTSHSVIDEHLFTEKGIYLKAVRMPHLKKSKHDLEREYGTHSEGNICIDLELAGVASNDTLKRSAYLGGERRRVEIESGNNHGYINKVLNDKKHQYLKLVLATHGDFGNWVPEWLLKDGNIENSQWVQEPRSGVEVKLLSAVINGWAPCSGWDYDIRRPKPFRKLVKPGSVYLIELKNLNESEKLIGTLHGESICFKDSAAEKDGYGQVIIAGCNPETIERL